jgi:uncharacterized Zn-finger protein|tara:strand:+ start:184 stop:471 length:288 start_codon:yes stop_codon:yes gene_type:complete
MSRVNKTDDPDYFKNYYKERRQEKLTKQKLYNDSRKDEIREYQREYNIKNRQKKRDYYLSKKTEYHPEKVPCPHCGKLLTKNYLLKHILRRHPQS